MSARNADPVDVRWYVSSYSTQTSGNCVETGVGVADWVGVRDTKNRGGGMLAVPRGAWSSFACAVRDGRLTWR